MERKIGEKFTINGKTYVVEIAKNHCNDCAFLDTRCTADFDIVGTCIAGCRYTDYNSVIFKEVKQNNTNMKPFNLEEEKAGKPVCTRSGAKARIMCYDVKGGDNKRILALIDVNGVETPMTYYENGKIFNGDNVSYDIDLMMATEKKRGYIALYKPEGSKTTFSLVASYVYDTIELLETYTDKNGRIAIKEIE